MKFHDVQQTSEEWIRLRLGIPTASNFDQIMTPAKMQLSKSADKLIARLIGEKLSPFLPDRAESYASRAMQWGQETEAEARRFYEMEKNCTVTNGGFCTTDDEKLGCSPDGLIGDDGCIEIKCPEPGTHVGYLLAGTLPDEYKPQVHGHLIVTNRKYCDFLSYAIGLPPLLVRVEPDLYTVQLADVIYKQFLPRYEELLAKVKPKS